MTDPAGHRATCHHGRRADRRADATRRGRVRRRRHGHDRATASCRSCAGSPGRRGSPPGCARRPGPVAVAVVRRDRDALKALASRAAFAGRAHDDGRARPGRRSPPRSRVDGLRRRHRRPRWRGTATTATRPCSCRRRTACTCARWPPRLGVDGVVAPSSRSAPTAAAPARLVGGNCRGTAKVARLHAWLDEHHGGRGAVELWAYGDSPGDRELLADADHAVWAKDVVARRRRPRRCVTVGRRRAGPHGPAAAVAEERPRVRRARRGRRARPVGRPVAHAARVRRVLPRRQLDLPVERRPRRRQADRIHPTKRRRPGRRRRSCPSPRPRSSARCCPLAALGVAALTGRWQTVAVVGVYIVVLMLYSTVAQARRRARHRHRGVGLRAARGRRRGRRRRADVELVRARHRVRLAVHRDRQALRRDARDRRGRGVGAGHAGRLQPRLPAPRARRVVRGRPAELLPVGVRAPRRDRVPTGRSTSCRSCRC